MRRAVAVVAAILLFVEAVGLVIVNAALGKIADAQSMSLDGLDPDVMATSSFVLAGVVFLYLGGCGVVLLVSAFRGRPHGRFARVLLISAAVLHAVLGALTVGMVGWEAFAFMMVMFGLIVLSLMGYEGKPAEPEDTPPAPPAPANGGEPQAA
ncbi:hypothetical protein H9Y04_34935 [Streptomyces sp. TRM66268-LWL]|uniref:Integral membrane protein n=1 Tax=Streptomyces polyasparticus TaxID=2767826 RepID=A0ABR7SQH1_9ACTN|nr:hypothetical protein [Streptomyces polyasparticus]MBC9717740.1 hypothetical protein [Streptomyces polyasparticus]